MTSLSDLRIKLFADGADIDQIKKQAEDPRISGWTTNPTLARKAGVTDYMGFIYRAASIVAPRPISCEVFADDLATMESQGRVLAGFGANINVKIPITNTNGEFTGPVITALSRAGIAVNVTAVFTEGQVIAAAGAFSSGAAGYISIFAGRIADTGEDPIPIVAGAHGFCPHTIKIIWASPREVFNIWQAEEAGADIITIDSGLIAKLGSVGKSLDQFSLETVKMFAADAQAAGFTIPDIGGYGMGGFGEAQHG